MKSPSCHHVRSADHSAGPVFSAANAKVRKTMKQAQGTLAKVIAMIEADAYCPEVIQQVDSVSGLLKTAKRELLAGHLNTCVARRLVENKKQAIAELLKIYNLSN